MTDFEHERLDAYRAALAWLIIADEIAEDLPRRPASQGCHVSLLNIAEGADDFFPW